MGFGASGWMISVPRSEGDFRRVIRDRLDPVAFDLPFERVLFRQTDAQVEVVQLDARR